jgi:hypothetical protein
MVAALCVVVGALLLMLIFVLGSGGPNNTPTANTNPTQPVSATSTVQVTPSTQATPLPTASSTATAGTVSTPTPDGTAYPGQQYIDGAQMATGVDKSTMQPEQVTTTFPVGSNMYVIFNIHPPSQGGAVCTLWYLTGNPTPVTSYNFNVSGTIHSSYTYATYGSPGQAYVELYWASDKSCSDKVLAQHVDFTVTAS